MKIAFTACMILWHLHGMAQAVPGKSFMVNTTGKFPFLEYGLGDDRLGGAKMSYLDSNVVLLVVDSSGSDYKVQLSKYHTAYIAKESTRIIPGRLPQPYHLTTSWKVYGDSTFDYVSVNVNERLPYSSRHEVKPSRIVVDIFGATSNTNWITLLKNAKEVENAYYEQAEDDVFRVIIELKHAQHWGHSIYYDSTGKKLIVRIKRAPVHQDIKKLRIAVDAGHGGDNSGATGISTHILEKDYTLLFAKQLQATFKRAGIKNVFMTRLTDTSLSMIERLAMLKANDPDILVSIHLNSSSVDSIRGTSTYYRYIGFRSLSVNILNRMLSLKLKEFGNIGSFNFALSGPTDYPNCLVEVAFLSNIADEKMIMDPKFHKAVAGKIYSGISDWFKAASR